MFVLFLIHSMRTEILHEVAVRNVLKEFLKVLLWVYCIVFVAVRISRISLFLSSIAGGKIRTEYSPIQQVAL